MPQPFRRETGVYHLNARVPANLLTKVRGTSVALPLGDAFVAVKASDKVMLSLRTKEGGSVKLFLLCRGPLGRETECDHLGPSADK